MISNLSITIITLNEAENIERCLKSVVGLSDDIILVDSGSKDKTVDIAKKYKTRVFLRTFDNYANQKNYAMQKTKYDWVLSVDADEEISIDLAKEIKKAIQITKFDAYTIPRKNIILGKYIRYTRWQPELDRHVWLWKKSCGKWHGQVHEEVQVEGLVGRLQHAKIHHQYKTVSEFFDMMDKYSDLDAQKILSRSKYKPRFLGVKMIASAFYNFLVRYVYRLGFLDGWRGFVLSYLMAIYQINVFVKLYENISED